MNFNADFWERGYVKKLDRLKPPGPGPTEDLGELNTEEIETIELLVLEIWLSQISPANNVPILCLFVF